MEKHNLIFSCLIMIQTEKFVFRNGISRKKLENVIFFSQRHRCLGYRVGVFVIYVFKRMLALPILGH